MHITSGNYSIRSVCRPAGGMIQTGVIVFDSPIQRESNQWNAESYSLLIKSVLQNYYIPPIFVSEEPREGRKRNIMNVIDGQQRLSVLYAFFTNKFRLLKKVFEDFTYDGQTYDLTGLTYEGLPDELKEQIDTYNLQFVIAKDAEEFEIEDMFSRLNNGKPLTRVQKSRADMGIIVSARINPLSSHPFIKELSGFSATQIKNEDNLKAIVQTMMILDPKHVLKDISIKSVAEYMTNLKSQWQDPERAEELDAIVDKIYNTLEYLEKSLTGMRIKPISKYKHLPILIITAIYAQENDISSINFASWAQVFSDALKLSSRTQQRAFVQDYYTHLGKGDDKEDEVYGRIDSMKISLDEYLEDSVIPTT